MPLLWRGSPLGRRQPVWPTERPSAGHGCPSSGGTAARPRALPTAYRRSVAVEHPPQQRRARGPPSVAAFPGGEMSRALEDRGRRAGSRRATRTTTPRRSIGCRRRSPAEQLRSRARHSGERRSPVTAVCSAGGQRPRCRDDLPGVRRYPPPTMAPRRLTRCSCATAAAPVAARSVASRRDCPPTRDEVLAAPRPAHDRRASVSVSGDRPTRAGAADQTAADRPPARAGSAWRRRSANWGGSAWPASGARP